MPRAQYVPQQQHHGRGLTLASHIPSQERRCSTNSLEPLKLKPKRTCGAKAGEKEHAGPGGLKRTCRARRVKTNMRRVENSLCLLLKCFSASLALDSGLAKSICLLFTWISNSPTLDSRLENSTCLVFTCFRILQSWNLKLENSICLLSQSTCLELFLLDR